MPRRAGIFACSATKTNARLPERTWLDVAFGSFSLNAWTLLAAGCGWAIVFCIVVPLCTRRAMSGGQRLYIDPRDIRLRVWSHRSVACQSGPGRRDRRRETSRGTLRAGRSRRPCGYPPRGQPRARTQRARCVDNVVNCRARVVAGCRPRRSSASGSPDHDAPRAVARGVRRDRAGGRLARHAHATDARQLRPAPTAQGALHLRLFHCRGSGYRSFPARRLSLLQLKVKGSSSGAAAPSGDSMPTAPHSPARGPSSP